MMICPFNNRSCRCDSKATDKKFHPCALVRRVGVMIRLLGSNTGDEAIAAAHGLRRLLPAEGLGFDDIAVLVENCDGKIEQLKYSDEDAELIFTRGVEEGRKQNAGPVLSAQYFDADSEPRWAEMAKFCQSSPARTSLKSNEQEFIDEMLVKLRWRAPTRPMGGFLLSIFWKLGGSFK